MIPFDFDYDRPSSVQLAVHTFQSLQKQGKNPIYFGGGTEIIRCLLAGSPWLVRFRNF